MNPPFISYSTFHRLGLTARNLHALLSNTADDFELHIIDNNSQDGTWDYIQSLNDSRIKSKTRFDVNYGPIYPLNYNLTRRKPDQYFIVLESDVYLYVPDWISRFMKIFETFPEVGLLGLSRADPYPVYYPPGVLLQQKDGVSYLQLTRTEVGNLLDFVPGQCQMLRPELIDMIGYWSEENGYGDAELSLRVNRYTPFKAGYAVDIPIDMLQTVSCDACESRQWCKSDKMNYTCFDLWRSKHRNESFVLTHGWKYYECFKELSEGKRTVYCASIHDPASYQSHLYHMDWAQENFGYYAGNAN